MVLCQVLCYLRDSERTRTHARANTVPEIATPRNETLHHPATHCNASANKVIQTRRKAAGISERGGGESGEGDGRGGEDEGGAAESHGGAWGRGRMRGDAREGSGGRVRRVVAVHVDYGNRDESREEAAFLEVQC